MSLIACPDCGKEISNNADKCPHCGAKRQRSAIHSMVRVAFLLCIALVAIPVFMTCNRLATPSAPGLVTGHPSAEPKCTVAEIEIKTFKAGFVDRCRTRSCPGMNGAGTLINRCSTPIGVQVKFTALDAQGNVVSTKDMWPASIQNIPPGEYHFSLDGWLAHHPKIKSFTLSAITVKHW